MIPAIELNYSELKQADDENDTLSSKTTINGVEFVGKSPEILKLFNTVSRLKKLSLPDPILIMGETGTGKDLIARSLTECKKPFITVNCSAINSSLFESELFGHTENAFTGAKKHKTGYFRRADQGSLFLDEIGDLPLQTQAKLLRVIEDGVVMPVGADHSVETQVKIIAATHQNLQAMIEDHQFRDDLYFRLSQFVLSVPPLRERTEDIPDFVRFFGNMLRNEVSTKHLSLVKFTSDAIEKLTEYDWPGNVRELRGIVRSSIILNIQDDSKQVIITADQIAFPNKKPDSSGKNRFLKGGTLNLEEVTKELVAASLVKCHGNRTHAAQELGVARGTFQRWIKTFGLLEKSG